MIDLFLTIGLHKQTSMQSFGTVQTSRKKTYELQRKKRKEEKKSTTYIEYEYSPLRFAYVMDICNFFMLQNQLYPNL